MKIAIFILLLINANILIVGQSISFSNQNGKLVAKVVNGTEPVVNLQDTIPVCKGEANLIEAVDSASYTYSWSTGETSYFAEVIGGSTDTLIHVEVENQFGCVKKDTAVLLADSMALFSLGPDTVACGDLLLSPTPSFGAGYSYKWNNILPNPSYLASSSGLYFLRITNPNGCKRTDSVNVTIMNQVIADLGADTLICDPYTLDAGVATTYDWSTGDQTQSIQVNTEGEYVVTINQSTPCPSSDTIYITVFEDTLYLGADTTICTPLTLNAGNADSYNWNTSESSQTIDVASTGTFSVEIQTGACVAYDEINIQWFDDLVSVVGTPAAVSLGNTNQFVGTPAGGTFSGPGISSSGLFDSQTAGLGTHTLTYTYSEGNCSSDYLFDVVVADDLSMDELSSDGWRIYPNPSDGMTLLVELDSQDIKEQVLLYSSDGRLLFSSRINNGLNNLQIPILAPGIYTVVRFSDTNQIGVKYLVVI